ncbi:uncharacterized protein LOC128680443 [Plodia interpunctella]|uniref:uncharacterized protein LOC128680443 n=1 Tax=Plodia interpunctella TaxID=58824 RepID=UPI002367E9F1|nr:uncharacterized protein LOC128680443 [Plodia interpunctella]
MKYMDRLPTVISCCFCCFLRAGTVMIAMFSFIVGLIFAPNVNNTKGFWDLEQFLSYYSSVTEMVLQVILGAISIMLCIVSMMLIIGSCCNMPMLIEVYQWGACIYSIVVSLLFLVLAFMCFFIHSDCFVAGWVLCGLIVCNIGLTIYFVIVANSLRMSLVYLATTDILNL